MRKTGKAMILNGEGMGIEHASGPASGTPFKDGREHLAAEVEKISALIFHRLRKRVNGERCDQGINGSNLSCVLGREFQNPENDPGKIERLEADLSLRIEESQRRGVFLPLRYLSRVFRLSPFETDVLLACLAPEINPNIGVCYAKYRNGLDGGTASIGLLLDLLCASESTRMARLNSFAPQAPLARYDLVKERPEDRTGPWIERRLKLDDRIVHYLLGSNAVDLRIASFVRLVSPRRSWNNLVLDETIKDSLKRIARRHFDRNQAERLIFHFRGRPGVGRKLAAEAFCESLKLPLLVVDSRELSSAGQDLDRMIIPLFREALLQPSALYFDHFDAIFGDDPKDASPQGLIAGAVEEFSFITFLAGEKLWNPSAAWRERPVLPIVFPAPGTGARRELWRSMLNGSAAGSEAVIEHLADKYRFTGGEIRDAAACGRSLAAIDGRSGPGEMTAGDLVRACRLQARSRLSEMARKIEPRYGWSDIILPEDKIRLLREISLAVTYRRLVFEQWGFDRKLSLGKGLNALFTGPSGTGKTMAAEILAGELDLDLFKIDLSCVISKYIGETEKHLARVFQEAESSSAVLFFDEADALFGKRSEVRDSHDRYANIEINYLLQKMEEHEGIVILATNFQRAMDEAFVRRMHYAVEFPFPDEGYRLRIWKNIFPVETPLADDIDLEFLAGRFKISGGHIKNIALNASFLSAREGGPVGMKHLVRATRREYQKMGRISDPAEFGKYAGWIESNEDADGGGQK